MTNIKDAERCTHCGLCRAACPFLSKHDVVIGDTEKLKDLAYHCFLCGECTRVCPEEIDGRGVLLELRQETVATEDGNARIRSTYKGAFSEKADYKFRNYRRATKGAVFFPGCNFPSLYPKTAENLSKLLKDQFGIGTIYDCCGKPIGELGCVDEEKRIIDEMNKRFEDGGITELITACPNCKDYLEGRINIPVVDIYTKLKELGLGKTIAGDIKVYIPCPDRAAKSWLEAVREYVEGEISVVEGVNCCGLGGIARVEEPEIASSFVEPLKEIDGDIYTYCGSCVGNFTRNGRPVSHVLPSILGTNEKPDTGKSYINRAMTKYKR